MKLAFIGIGNVGLALAERLTSAGHKIIIAHNNSSSASVKSAVEKNPGFEIKGIQEAVNEADLVFLATPFQANEEVLKGINFNGKTLIDCTNPVGAGISHGLKSEISGLEMVQRWAPDAKAVKSFTIYGFENFKDNSFPKYNVKPVMMICGNDSAAKNQVREINSILGFETLDTGEADQALHLEHMTLLWVKMARRDGHHPNFVWAYLER